MAFSDDEPKDWEIEAEKPPEKLRHKWAQGDWEGQQPVVCSACRQTAPPDALSCIFCGAELHEGKSGTLIAFLSWIKKIFR
ncbi:MAG: hypothetical protein HYZ85_03035 [Candidatus Omnitrophica bacterium]|nr:hypothetical protein [Candidatus Omnitrophota bacterium]